MSRTARSPRTRSLRALLLLVALVTATGPVTLARAQPAASGPTGGAFLATGPGQAPTGLELDTLDARIESAKASTTVDEATRARTVDALTQAREWIQKAQEWSARAADFDARRADAPARLAEIRQALARPDPDIELVAAPGTPLGDLEAALGDARAHAAAAQEDRDGLEREYVARGERRAELPKLTADRRRELDQLTEQLRLMDQSSDASEAARASRTLLEAHRYALEQEIFSYGKELASYEARSELLTARRDLSARVLAQAEKLVHAWQSLVEDRRRGDVGAAAQAARQAVRGARQLHPVLGELAADNAALAEQRVELAQQSEASVRDLEQARDKLEWVEDEYRDARTRVDAAGLSDAVGLLLRQTRSDLPPVKALERRIGARKVAISDALLKRIELEDERVALVDPEQRVQRILEQIDGSLDAEKRAAIEARADDLLEARHETLTKLLDDQERLFTVLVNLDTTDRELLQQTESFASFIDERILWIRSDTRIWHLSTSYTVEAAAWMLSPANWLDVAKSLGTDLKRDGGIYLLALLVLAPLVAAQKRLRRELRESSEQATRPLNVSFRPTMRAVLLTLGIALAWPAVLGFLGQRLAAAPFGGDFVRAAGGGLVAAAWTFFAGELLRQVCRPEGLAHRHLAWPDRAIRPIRRHLLWLIPVVAVSAFIARTLEIGGTAPWLSSLGRIVFLVGMASLAVFLVRLLHPGRGVLPEGQGKRTPLRSGWFLLGAGAPVALGVLAMAGYSFTAAELAGRLGVTLALFFGLLVVYALGLRWLLLGRRALAIQQAREQRRAAREAAKGEGGGEAEGALAQRAVDLASVDTQTRTLLRISVRIAGLLGLWWIWVDVLPALNFLRRFELWSHTATVQHAVTAADGSQALTSVQMPVPVTLADAVLAVLVVGITWLAGRNLPGVLEIVLSRQFSMRGGERYAITTLVRYAITMVGVVAAFGAIGVGWSEVQWLAAAVTVGLGFGLQEIFANFVSGLILLFERPVRVGDIVTVGDTEGTVTKIQTRATTISDWDRRELIVPNKEFITNRFINWTLSDPVTRAVVPVGLAYGSDTEKAHALLLEIAKRSPNVLDDPAPTAIFKRFGDSTLDVDLRVFLASRDLWPQVVHQLHTEIHKEFAKAGIEIAFPQRDLHVRSIGELRDVLAPVPARPPEAPPTDDAG